MPLQASTQRKTLSYAGIPPRSASKEAKAMAHGYRQRQLYLLSKKIQVAANKGRPYSQEWIRKERARIMKQSQQYHEAALKQKTEKYLASAKAEAEYAVRSSQTTAQSAAVKESEARERGLREVQQGTATIDPKTGGIIYQRKIKDSVSVSESAPSVEGGGQTTTRKIKDSVSVDEPVRPVEEKEPGRIILPEQIARAEYEAQAGSENIKARYYLKEPIEIDYVGSAPIEARQPEKRYRPGEASVNVLKEAALGLTAPTPSPVLNIGLLATVPKTALTLIEKQREIYDPGPTLLSSTIEQTIRGEPISGTGRGTAYDIESGAAETLLILTPFKKVPWLKLEAARVPTGTGFKTIARSFTISYGGKSRELLSKAGEKIKLGKAKIEEPIEIKATTREQQQRGVQLAGESSITEQRLLTDIETISKIKGLAPGQVERAATIKRIIELGSKSKDPARQGFGEKPFKKIETEETPSLMKSFEKQQKRLTGKLGGVEGSLSQRPYLLEKYLGDLSGDFDFHLGKFKTAAARARETALDIEALSGREFEARVSAEFKSAKVWVEEKGRAEKVGEFLNPEERDPEGVLQIVKGDTAFAQKIPEKTLKVEGLKTFTLQRQFLKKGQSIFSLQETERGFVLEPFAPRKVKDISHFYAIGKTKAENLRAMGKTKEAAELEAELSKFKKQYKEVDMEDFFKKGGAEDIARFEGEASLLSKVQKSSGAYASNISKIKSSLYSSRGGDISKSGYASKNQESNLSKSANSLKNSVGVSAASVSGSASSAPSKPQVSRPSITRPSKGSIGSPGYGSPGSPGSPGRPGRGSSQAVRYSQIRKQLTQKEQARKPIAIIAKLKTRESKGKERPEKPRIDYIGNVPITKVEGIYKEPYDITYGDIKSAKLEKSYLKKEMKKTKNVLNIGSVSKSKASLKW